MLRLFSGLAALVVVVAAQNSTAHADALQQLHNKTVQLHWTTTVVQHGDDGKSVTSPIDNTRTIYISSAGRLFTRASRANTSNGRSQMGDLVPGARQNKAGEARDVHVAGNKLIGSLAFTQGASQFIVTFDGSFSSCSLDVVYGREAGGMRRKGMNGVMYTIDSATASGQSCSIREGNPFADH